MTTQDKPAVGPLSAENWTPWSGGARPHPPTTRVQVRFRDGREDEGQSAFAHWWHEGGPDDIIAFRLAPTALGEIAGGNVVTDKNDTALVATINYLRADEGDTVSLLCDNPDFNGQPNNAVECNGGWTDWMDKRFTGDSLFSALNNAALAKAVATKTLAPKPLAAPASPLPRGGGDDWKTCPICLDTIPSECETDQLVDRFADALKAKLRSAGEKYGFDDAWKQDDWRDKLIEDLWRHVQKGDPRDVAAYCAFAWHHGWSLTQPDTGKVEASGETRDDLIEMLSDWFENKVNGFRDSGEGTIEALGDFGQVFSHFDLADRILALITPADQAKGGVK